MKINVGIIGHIEGPRLSQAIANLLKDEKGFQFNFLEMPYNKNSVSKFIEGKDLVFVCNPGESDINKYVRSHCQKQKIDFFIPNEIDNRRMPTLEAKYGLSPVFQLILGYNNSGYINSKLVEDLTAEKMLKLWKDAYIERPYNFPKKDKDLWNWFESDDCPYPWLQLDLNVPHEKMYMEAINVKNKSIMHRSDEAGGTWNATTLFGLASDITSGYDYVGVDKTKYPTKPKPAWTELADECPITKRFFMEEFPLKNYSRIRFSWIEPGGYILPHQDAENRCMGFNLAINNPKGAGVYVKDWGMIPYEPGTAFIWNVGTIHWVHNDSNKARLHMIIHGDPDKEKLLPLMRKSWDKYGWNK